MDLSFATATDADAAEVTRLRAAVAEHLTRRFGHGHWSSIATEKAVLRDIRTSHVLLARCGSRAVGTLRLATRKPWAIDPKYFSQSADVLYLTDMAVDPPLQGRGIGRRCLERARAIAAAWPAAAIRLDAYDGEAGAGDFYRKCGFHERGRIIFRRTPLIYYEMLI